MPTYLVTLPIAGSVTIEVEADSKEGAIEVAMYTEEDLLDCLDSLDIYKHLTRGNVSYAPLNSAYATEVS